MGWEVPAVSETRVVDVTGCGNAFCGGFLSSFDQSRDLLKSAIWGAVAASFMAEEKGVPKAGIPSLKVSNPIFRSLKDDEIICPPTCTHAAQGIGSV